MEIEKYLVEFKVKGCKCLRCGHKWIPKKPFIKPFLCPKCKSPYWNTKRKK